MGPGSLADNEAAGCDTDGGGWRRCDSDERYARERAKRDRYHSDYVLQRVSDSIDRLSGPLSAMEKRASRKKKVYALTPAPAGSP